MSSRKRKQSEISEKKELLPPKSNYPIFESESGIESIINYLNYPELVEFGKINRYYQQIIYLKHPGSRTHAITDITEYLKIFKQPEYMRITNAMNLRNLKKFLLGSNKIKSLDLTEKEINADIFSDLNLDNIEELVIGKFPKDNTNQLLSYFKKLKKLTYNENTYICPRESQILPKLFHSFVSNNQKNYFKDCNNNSINGFFEVNNTGKMPYKYYGYVRNNNPAISGAFHHSNGCTFRFAYNLDLNSAFSTIEGTFFNCSTNNILYKCKTRYANNANNTPYPCLNTLKWKVTFNDGNYYTGNLFYGMLHNLSHEPSKMFCEDETMYFEGSFENGMKKKGKDYSKTGFLMYDGTFVNNQFDGVGTFYYSNGYVYKGEFKENKFSGLGELYDKNNNLILKGTFLDNFLVKGDKYVDKVNKLSGRFENGHIVFGTLFKDGVSTFEGFFDKSENLENGTIYYPNGKKKYVGAIQNNKPHGYGKLYNREGQLIYDGEYKDNKYHGKGIIYVPNMMKLEGNFENNLTVGFFTITYNSGNIIKASFVNEILQGKSSIILASGKTCEGNITCQLDNENRIYTFINEQTGKTYISTLTTNNLFDQLEKDL